MGDSQGRARINQPLTANSTGSIPTTALVECLAIVQNDSDLLGQLDYGCIQVICPHDVSLAGLADRDFNNLLFETGLLAGIVTAYESERKIGACNCRNAIHLRLDVPDRVP